MSWSSIRCFWRWPLGHRWAIGEDEGETVLRCDRCGKKKHRSRFSAPEGGAPEQIPKSGSTL
jgi:hypothetical protein